MSKLLILPITAYFGYTGFVLLSEPNTFQKQFDKAIVSLPTPITELVQQVVVNPLVVKALGGVMLFIAVCTFFGVKSLLKLVSLLQFAFIAIIIGGIVEHKLEMQALSEALERIAYQLCLVGMIYVVSSVDRKVSTKQATKTSKKAVKPQSSSDEKDDEEDVEEEEEDEEDDEEEEVVKDVKKTKQEPSNKQEKSKKDGPKKEVTKTQKPKKD